MQKPNIINVIQRSIDVMGKKNSSAYAADVLLTPMDEYIGSIDIAKADWALDCGRREAAEKINDILALL